MCSVCSNACVYSVHLLEKCYFKDSTPYRINRGYSGGIQGYRRYTGIRGCKEVNGGAPGGGDIETTSILF